MIKLGDRVRNRINGQVGLATGRTEYMNGCRQFLLQPESLDKDGKALDGTWWDEQFLDVTETQVLGMDPFEVHAQPIAGGPSGGTSRATR